jgi:penicillin-binding protein 1C
MVEIEVCSKSGYRKSEFCPEIEIMSVVRKGLESPICSYHQQIHLTPDLQYRVNSSCESVDRMVTKSWFILPPIQEYYYRSKNLSYSSVPPFRNDCLLAESISPMDIIYPKEGSKIYVPKGLTGDSQHIVFEAVHRNPQKSVYWHIDGEYMGMSRKNHHFGLNLQKGAHILTLVDEDGAVISRNFAIISN